MSPTGMRTTTVIACHFGVDLKVGGKTHRERIVEALRPMPVDVVNVLTKGGFSDAWGTRLPSGIASKYNLERLVARYAPRWREGDPLVVIAFSAACWALRERSWIGSEFAKEHLTAGIFLDGLHTSSLATLQPTIDFAEHCIATGGASNRLIITNSEIDPVTYADTSETAELFLDAIGCKPRQARDDGYMPGVRVVDYGVTNTGGQAADHVAHVSKLLPMVLEDEVGVLLHRVVGATEPEMPAVTVPVVDTITPRPLVERVIEARRQAIEACPVRNVGGQLLHVPTKTMVAKWLSVCTRYYEGIGEKRVDITAGNFCAAFQAWALSQAMFPGERLPHALRCGAKELIEDAMRAGTWRPIRTRAKLKEMHSWYGDVELTPDYVPSPGDLAIYHRGPTWQGHVDAVTKTLTDNTWLTDGANEIYIPGEVSAFREGQTLTRDHPKLLGFVTFDEDVIETTGITIT